MQILFYSISVFGIAGLFALIHAAFTAPEAIEDERGFHLLEPAANEGNLYPSQLTLTEGDVVFFK